MKKVKMDGSQSAEEMLKELKSDLGIKIKIVDKEPSPKLSLARRLVTYKQRIVMNDPFPPTDSKKKRKPIKPESSNNE